LKSPGRCQGMELSMPITRLLAQAAIRLRGRDVFMPTRIANRSWVKLVP